MLRQTELGRHFTNRTKSAFRLARRIGHFSPRGRFGRAASGWRGRSEPGAVRSALRRPTWDCDRHVPPCRGARRCQKPEIFTFLAMCEALAHMLDHLLDQACALRARKTDFTMQDLGEIRAGQSVRRHHVCFGHVFPPTPDPTKAVILNQMGPRKQAVARDFAQSLATGSQVAGKARDSALKCYFAWALRTCESVASRYR